MKECPLFRFEKVSIILKESDRILCASLWQQYLVSSMQVFGTEKGVLHILEHDKRLMHCVEYKKPIKNIHCFNSRVAFCCEDTAVLYNIDTDADILNTSELGVKCVQVNSTDSTGATIFTATNGEIAMLQYSWVYPKTSLFVTKMGIEAIRVCEKYLAVQCKARVMLLLASTGEKVSEIPQRSMNLMCWIAPNLLGVGTENRTFQFLKVSEEGILEESEELTQKCEFAIAELAGFYLEFALVLGMDRVLRLLEQNGDCQEIATEKWARIVSELRLSPSFFLVFESGIEKVTANSEAERLKWFLDEHKYREAFYLMEKRNLPKTDIFDHCRQWLLYSIRSESEADCRDICTELLDKEILAPEHLLQLVNEEPPLLPLITEVPSSAITDNVAASIVSKLVQNNFESLVIHCIGTWDQSLIKNEQIMAPVVSSSMSHAKVQLFLACEHTSAALRALFHIKSSDLFPTLKAHPAEVVGFLKGLSREELVDLVKIDRNAAVKLLGKTDCLDPDVVAREIPSEERGKYLEKRWAKGLRSSPNTDAWLLEHRLKTGGDVLGLIASSVLLDKDRALELCAQHSHIRAQAVLLNRLNRGKEIKSILCNNFEELVHYLTTRWDKKIWKHAVKQQFSQTLHGALLSVSHMQMENEGVADLCEMLPEQSRMLRYVKELLGNMKQAENLKRQYFKAAFSSLSVEQSKSLKKIAIGAHVEADCRCVFCLQPITDFALFRRCGHHVHIECEIDEECRFCEKSSARC